MQLYVHEWAHTHTIPPKITRWDCIFISDYSKISIEKFAVELWHFARRFKKQITLRAMIKRKKRFYIVRSFKVASWDGGGEEKCSWFPVLWVYVYVSEIWGKKVFFFISIKINAKDPLRNRFFVGVGRVLFIMLQEENLSLNNYRLFIVTHHRR